MPLLKNHWEEIGLVGSSALTLDVDHDFYDYMELIDRHVVFTIRKEKTVIGYLSFLLQNHCHHRTEIFANTDCFFVKKEERNYKTGKLVLEMFRYAESVLRNYYNVSHIALQVSVENDLQKLAKSLNFVRSDIVYMKSLR